MAVLVALSVKILRQRPDVVVLITAVIALLLAVVGFCAWFPLSPGQWVYLYSDRVEIQHPLVKFLGEHLARWVGKPNTIFYRDITSLEEGRRWSGRALGIRVRTRRWTSYWLDREYIDGYADLEAELLRRVPHESRRDP